MRRALPLAFLFLAGCASGPSTAPMPPTVNITPPAANVPANVKALSGKWAGRWDGDLDHILIVEEVEQLSAVAVYSWGSSHSRGITPGWQRVRGTVEPGLLRMTLRNQAKVTYRVQTDGTLQGTYEWTGGVSRATLNRMQP